MSTLDPRSIGQHSQSSLQIREEARSEFKQYETPNIEKYKSVGLSLSATKNHIRSTSLLTSSRNPAINMQPLGLNKVISLPALKGGNSTTERIGLRGSRA